MQPTPTAGAVAILGLPSDADSSYRRGPAQGPAAIRRILQAGAMNLCAEDGTDLDGHARLVDLGDLDLSETEPIRNLVPPAVSAVLERDAMVLALGGDHAVTYPVLQAYAQKYDDLTVLHLDAHPDLYDEYGGNRYSHACPMARILEDGLVKRLVQVGVRAANTHQREQTERFGVENVGMNWRALPPLDGPIYVSVDLDVLDPGFAPGVSHPEPGGLSTREVIDIIQGLKARVVGADIVELNPTRDLSDVTSVTAAKLVKELAAKMLAGAV